jgi:hypothetical protein
MAINDAEITFFQGEKMRPQRAVQMASFSDNKR